MSTIYIVEPGPTGGPGAMGAQILRGILQRDGHRVSSLRLSQGGSPQLTLLGGPAPVERIHHSSQMPRPDAWFISCIYPRQWLHLRDLFARMGLAPMAARRSASDPIVAFGGQAMIAPEPIADFADVIAVGDGEITGVGLARLAGEYLKADVLRQVTGRPGYYVPSVQRPPARLVRVEGSSYDAHPVTVGERDRAVTVELARGCRSKCAFCSIGWAGGTYREAPQEQVAAAVQAHAGRAINLFAPDYSSVSWAEGADQLLEDHGCTQRGRDARLDATERRMAAGASVREFSFGIEGVSERMRRAIAKPLADDRIVQILTGPLREVRCKLYLIPGLPGETADDRAEFVALLDRLVAGRTATLDLTLTLWQSVPHTPLQYDACPWSQEVYDWCMSVRETLRRWHSEGRGQHLASQPKGRETHEHDVWLQRADRRASAYLLRASEGSVASGRWRAIAAECGLEVEPLLGAISPADAAWAHVDVGVPRDRPMAARVAYDRAVSA